YSGEATISLLSGPAGASFTPVTVSVSGGLAVFNGPSLGQLSNGTNYVFKVSFTGLPAPTTKPVDVVAPTPGLANYSALPFAGSIRGAAVSAALDGSPTSVITLSMSSLPYGITEGELSLFNFNGGSGSKTIDIVGQGEFHSVVSAGGTSRVFEVI